jgi:DNA-binding CsgD family transcriptional regulator
LVVSVPGADERGASVFERVLDHANAELATMVDQAAITAEAAEAKLAAKLALGSGIESAAASLGVSRETARTQLKAVFAKTNTRRQAELAALVARFRS